MTEVRTPVRGWNGTFNGDHFVDGVCQEANPANLSYYRRHGYHLAQTVLGDRVHARGERPAHDAKKAEWVAYATARGINCEGLTTQEIIHAVDQL